MTTTIAKSIITSCPDWCSLPEGHRWDSETLQHIQPGLGCGTTRVLLRRLRLGLLN
jgi:hypothetical protein